MNGFCAKAILDAQQRCAILRGVRVRDAAAPIVEVER